MARSSWGVRDAGIYRMYYPIGEVSSISQKLRRQLLVAGIKTTEELLDRAPPEPRAALVRSTGATEDEMLRAIRIADLMRVKGVGASYGALLVAAGIHGATTLAEAKIAALHGAFPALKSRVPELRRLPNPGQIDEWIRGAAGLSPIVT